MVVRGYVKTLIKTVEKQPDWCQATVFVVADFNSDNLTLPNTPSSGSCKE